MREASGSLRVGEDTASLDEDTAGESSSILLRTGDIDLREKYRTGGDNTLRAKAETCRSEQDVRMEKMITVAPTSPSEAQSCIEGKPGAATTAHMSGYVGGYVMRDVVRRACSDGTREALNALVFMTGKEPTAAMFGDGKPGFNIAADLATSASNRANIPSNG